jgi:hypothetical protein
VLISDNTQVTDAVRQGISLLVGVNKPAKCKVRKGEKRIMSLKRAKKPLVVGLPSGYEYAASQLS